MLSWAYESAVDLLVKMDCLETEQHSCAKKLNSLKCSNSMPLWVSCTVRSVSTGWFGWYTRWCIFFTLDYCVLKLSYFHSVVCILQRKLYRKTSELQTINHHPGSTTTAPLPQHTTTTQQQYYHHTNSIPHHYIPHTTRSSSSGIRVAIVAVGAAVGGAPAAASCGPGLVDTTE